MKPNKTHLEIRQLGPHDVVLGPGNGRNESVGNVRFRESIRFIIEDSGLRKVDVRVNQDLAHLIVARIKEIGGKFVKKTRFGTFSETSNGIALEIVYEEVCDSLACEKVQQCIRHQLVRKMLPHVIKKSSSKSRKTNTQALPTSSSNANMSLTSKLACTPSPKKPGSLKLSTTTSALGGTFHHQRRLLHGDISCASSLVDLLQHHIKPSTVIPTVDSQASMHEDHLTADHLPSGRHRGALAPPKSKVLDDRFSIMQLLQRQEMALLEDTWIKKHLL